MKIRRVIGVCMFCIPILPFVISGFTGMGWNTLWVIVEVMLWYGAAISLIIKK